MASSSEFVGVPARIPRMVRLAGTIWVAVGVICLCYMMAGIAAVGKFGGPGPGEWYNVGTHPAFLAVVGLVGLALIITGYRTLRGWAHDTLGNAAGSILLAVVFLSAGAGVGFGGFLSHQKDGQPVPRRWTTYLALMAATAGLPLLAAGGAAIGGRGAYLLWRSRDRGNPQV